MKETVKAGVVRDFAGICLENPDVDIGKLMPGFSQSLGEEERRFFSWHYTLCARAAEASREAPDATKERIRREAAYRPQAGKEPPV